MFVVTGVSNSPRSIRETRDNRVKLVCYPGLRANLLRVIGSSASSELRTWGRGGGGEGITAFGCAGALVCIVICRGRVPRPVKLDFPLACRPCMRFDSGLSVKVIHLANKFSMHLPMIWMFKFPCSALSECTKR